MNLNISYFRLADFSLSQQLYVTQFLTSTRFTPYIVGVIFGFYIDRMELNGLTLKKLPKPFFFVFWFTSLSAILTICVIVFTEITHSIPDDLVGRFYVDMDAFFKFWWSLSLCWIAIACHFGRGGYINTFFSCRLFRILSKLCFSMYLIHFVIQLIISYYESDYTTFGIGAVSNFSLILW